MEQKLVYLEAAHAKINLFLEVLPDKFFPRQDGFHNLKTLFQSISLADYLTFEFIYSFEASENFNFEVYLDSNDEEFNKLSESNIIVKAINSFFSKLDESVLEIFSYLSIKIFVDKKIPMQAGLAGGSANAAATLRALDKFFRECRPKSYSGMNLFDLALNLGSDVPFCLISDQIKRIYAEGRGDIINLPAPFDITILPAKAKLILVRPNFGISTKNAFKWLEEHYENQLEYRGVDYTKTENVFFNSFEEVVFHKSPVLAATYHYLSGIERTDKVLLSGSGSTLIMFFDNNEDDIYLAELSENLANKLQASTYLASY
jgi:4-diphosphocytidyl-2-C-methyl-D-erythritol kinase